MNNVLTEEGQSYFRVINVTKAGDMYGFSVYLELTALDPQVAGCIDYMNDYYALVPVDSYTKLLKDSEALETLKEILYED